MRTTWRTAVLTVVLLIGSGAAERVIAATWTFQNTEFADGALTLSGSFDYDAGTNTYSGLVLNSAGAIVTAPHTALAASSSTFLGAVDGSGNLNGAPLFQIYFSSPLTELGGTVSLLLSGATSYGTCGDASCTAAFPIVFGTSGQVVAAAVPLPPAVWLLLSALALFASRGHSNPASRSSRVF